MCDFLICSIENQHIYNGVYPIVILYYIDIWLPCQAVIIFFRSIRPQYENNIKLL